MALDPLPLAALAASAAMTAVGLLLVRSSRARVRLALRLSGAEQVRVGELPEMDPLPSRPVRVAGRIRCADPLVSAGDERLVALHRDVTVRLADGGWRTIERLRETRSFELWDHDASLTLDPSLAAEPLVTIPHVWKGSPQALEDEAHRAALDRLARQGLHPVAARAETRLISVVERLLVLAHARREPHGGMVLVAPKGGFVISTLELPDAMRLLGGPRRRRMLLGLALAALGLLLATLTVVLVLLGL